MAARDVRTPILDSAEELFFNDGIAVTAIDAVARSADVSVVTVYKHFGSKDGLLEAVLERRLDAWKALWQSQIDAMNDPREQVLAIFPALSAYRCTAGRTQWCTFLATASERSSADDAPAAAVARDSALLRRRLRRYAMRADPDRASEIVATVLLVYNGVLSSILRGSPRAAAELGHGVAARALGWEDLGHSSHS